MVMVTHNIGDMWAGEYRLRSWGLPAKRQTMLDYGLSRLREKQRMGTLKKYHNEFNLIDEKLCQWKDSS